MENPSFFLEGVVKEREDMRDFEGPLSLILMLLSKNKIEIRDIRISDILDQYLEYLHKMESMDLEIASEFVQMASHLLYIKTKTLLSGEEEVSELEVLMASLEQLKCKDIYAEIQKISPQLKAASELGLLYYTKLPEPLPAEEKVYEYRHEPVDLLKALHGMFSRGGRSAAAEESFEAIPKRIVYSVRSKSRQILSLLRSGSIRLAELYSGCKSRGELIAAFISVLELCSMGSISIDRSGEDYSLSFVGGDMDEILEKIVE